MTKDHADLDEILLAGVGRGAGCPICLDESVRVLTDVLITRLREKQAEGKFLRYTRADLCRAVKAQFPHTEIKARSFRRHVNEHTNWNE